AMESESAGMVETHFGGGTFSGIVFTPLGTCNAAFGNKKSVLLIENCQTHPPAAFEYVFADCEDMIASTAWLRLNLERTERDVLLAFGVRHTGRFHKGQG